MPVAGNSGQTGGAGGGVQCGTLLGVIEPVAGIAGRDARRLKRSDWQRRPACMRWSSGPQSRAASLPEPADPDSGVTASSSGSIVASKLDYEACCTPRLHAVIDSTLKLYPPRQIRDGNQATCDSARDESGISFAQALLQQLREGKPGHEPLPDPLLRC